MAKEEFVKQESYLFKTGLQEKFKLTDRELEKISAKSKSLGLSEEDLIIFLIKSFSKGSIKVKKVNKPEYIIVGSKGNDDIEE